MLKTLKLKDKGRKVVYEPFENCPERLKEYGTIDRWTYDTVSIKMDKDDRVLLFMKKNISFIKKK